MMAQNFLFIGGAARSGTTLLLRLFDWHPDVFAFPTELRVFRRYWTRPEYEREYYFRELFFDKGQGEHFQFVDPEFLASQRGRLFKEFGNEISFEVNHSIFWEEYQAVLSKKGPLLDRVLNALANGLIKSNEPAKKRYTTLNYLLFKNPYLTEYYAQDLAKLLPNAKFIHMVRSPLDRYISAKMRRLRHMPLDSMHGVDFATAFCEIWISSMRLAEENLKAIGSDRYRIIHYEKLLANPESELRQISEWLEIDFTDSLLETTVLGDPVSASSTFDRRSTMTRIDTSSSNRKSQFFENTTHAERSIIYYVLGTANDLLNGYHVPEISQDQARSSWLLPFRYEPFWEYLRRLFKSSLNPTTISSNQLKTLLSDRLTTLVRENKAMV